MKPTDIMNFGKYKGLVLQDVMNDYPDYIDWCRKNIKWFIIEQPQPKVNYELIAADNAPHTLAKSGTKIALKLTDYIPVGKYKGQLIASIAMSDPYYLLWCIRAALFAVSEDNYLTIQEAAYLYHCSERNRNPEEDFDDYLETQCGD
jgi:uncharacterized protein (DUF3820 family)